MTKEKRKPPSQDRFRAEFWSFFFLQRSTITITMEINLKNGNLKITQKTTSMSPVLI